MKPLCIDLFCGLGGWTEGFLAEGYDVVGFDNTRHVYGDQKYPAQLVIQDVLTLDGRQFKGAAVIVASPPCQTYSYMAMPWSRAKALAAWYRGRVTTRITESDGKIVDEMVPVEDMADVQRFAEERQAMLNALFNACFRIAEEAGRPLIVENVKGAQPWVGRAQWHYGSFYLWGNVPALMPITLKAQKFNPTAAQRYREEQGQKVSVYSDPRRNGGKGSHLTNPAENLNRLSEGTKNGNDWFGSGEDCSEQRKHGSRSDSRKAASAQIAKIPFQLAQHIARVFRP